MAKLKNVSKRRHDTVGGISIGAGKEVEITAENHPALKKLHSAYPNDFLIVTDDQVAFPEAPEAPKAKPVKGGKGGKSKKDEAAADVPADSQDESSSAAPAAPTMEDGITS